MRTRPWIALDRSSAHSGIPFAPSRAVILVWIAVLLGGCVTLIGCGGRQPLMKLPSGGGPQDIQMTASSYKFTPNNIEAAVGDSVILHIENTSGHTHNFTLKDPHGKVMAERDLPPESTVAVSFALREPGTYKFHCDKPFHATFGMRGQIAVK